MRKDNTGMDADKSGCELSITEQFNQLSSDNNNDEGEFPDCDEFRKNELCKKRCESTGSRNSNTHQLTIIQNTLKDTRYEATSNRVRVNTPEKRDKEKFSLSPLVHIDGRRHTVHEVPSITVCHDVETRASMETGQNSLFDPRFLMPTESSVEQARYLLASKRGSLPCAGLNMRRRSLDMVTEEQPSDSTNEDNTMASLASLRVPRYRNRSRSLDTGLETTKSFSAFKESLKLRDVKKTRLGT